MFPYILKTLLYKYIKHFHNNFTYHLKLCKINHWLVLEWVVLLYLHPTLAFSFLKIETCNVLGFNL
jgi:hypothetical protein